MNLKNDLKTKNLETENKVQLANTVKSKIEELNLQKKPINISGQVSEKKKQAKKNNLL